MRKIFLSVAIMTISFITIGIPAVRAGSPNYGYSNEIAQLTYRGYVQCQSSYLEGKQHAVSGYLHYYIPGGRDPGRIYTDQGSSKYDARIHSRTYVFVDSFRPNEAKTQFRWGHVWWPDSRTDWPQGARLEVE
jgi:hypothetical protein